MPELERKPTEGAPARWVRAARTNLRRRMARSPIAFAIEWRGFSGQLRDGRVALPLRRSQAPAGDPLRQLGRLDHRGEARGRRRRIHRPPRDRRHRGHLARPAFQRRHVARGAVAREAPVAGQLGGGAARAGGGERDGGQPGAGRAPDAVGGRAQPAGDRWHPRRPASGHAGSIAAQQRSGAPPRRDPHRSRARRRIRHRGSHRCGGARER